MDTENAKVAGARLAYEGGSNQGFASIYWINCDLELSLYIKHQNNQEPELSKAN
ncbi:hypothetical protein [Iodobacter ciconiae]|uniref:hypothetical protein n=1 Tax=Iodobacter ciconiae TaxID=2496266 RepID=UPI0013E09DFD|nr:hypothetical protein [Iodobacter ciconiae]